MNAVTNLRVLAPRSYISLLFTDEAIKSASLRM